VDDGNGILTVCGSILLDVQTIDGLIQHELPIESGCVQNEDMPFPIVFVSDVNGILKNVSMAITVNLPAQDARTKTLEMEIVHPNGDVLGVGQFTSDFNLTSDPRGTSYRVPVSSGIMG
jgi:hypothetical protein